MSFVREIELASLGDSRGELVVLEENKNIPFDIKRVYYIYGVDPKIPRGFHAHKETKQVAICLSGQCTMLMDDGKNKVNVLMNSPKQGVLIDVMQWHEMHDFSEDCILMVLASDLYNESDYIRDYNTFKNLMDEKHV
ncbi:FdtA/QdtA family cupin domain-containing protein [Pseudoalteromonas luteoviolacea]|uniref:sugar 3,4-ketoisomerase n=1 Tax=Pseudoalteromonas luteoviolacea TaxID=43657 RepID=UPI001F1A404B|nr:FdtA/QdtA family cupin domain-containing protein [Pseudoalteromonas luteoviolacea]MCF6439051.1 FdtA/QdtA family cupin domain-containing protein [Pseudoalteromonas luteoviolacea]